mgnify:CR=1 FL=1
MDKPKTVKLTAGDRTFYILVNIFLAFIGLVIAIPIWSTITLSLRSNSYTGSNLEAMIPRFWQQHFVYGFNTASAAADETSGVNLSRDFFEIAGDELIVTIAENHTYELSLTGSAADYDVSAVTVDAAGEKKPFSLKAFTDGELSELPKKATTLFTNVSLPAEGTSLSFKVSGLEKNEKVVITLKNKNGDFDESFAARLVVSRFRTSLSKSAYSALLGNAGFIMAFWNSLKIFIFGVFTALFLTVPLSYCMSVKDLPGRKILNYFILIPYLFNIGMIPTYLVVQGLGLTNHLAAVFIPGAIGTYNCLIMRGFFEGIPESLMESARIDGAAEWKILLSIILPLSKPIILTIALYYGVGFWNDFMHPLLYLNDSSLQPLPILLRNILMASGMNEYVEVNAFGEAPVSAIKAASVFMSAIPMIIAYPFIQKYFTKGTMLGSVKG